MAAGACLTLALVHAGSWLRQRSRWADLHFAVASLGIGGVALVEMFEMRATTSEQFIAVHYWIHLGLLLAGLGLAGFVPAFFRAGRSWLLGLTVLLRVAVAVVNFVLPHGINYGSVPEISRLDLGGGALATVAVGIHTHWTHLDELAWTVAILFTIDAARAAWRRSAPEERPRLVRVAGAILFVYLLGVPLSALIHAGFLHSPYFVTPMFLVMLGAMGNELANDVARLSRVRDELVTSEARRRASEQSLELAAARQRSELAHLSRVAVLGELSASLAHELNQPLAAILSNAEAAQRFLDGDSVDLEQLREIVGDIVEDDKRAGEVIRRLRAMLRKEELAHVPLDVNEVACDVLQIMNSDFINRGVQVQKRLAPLLPPVAGDRVQLQQVLLNLLMNGCDAVSPLPRPRRLVVSTRPAAGGEVEIAVSDSGPGIAVADLERVFQPFVTTKEQGTGLGLAVCRTIVAAHGGRIWASNNDQGGATITIALPAVDSPPPTSGPPTAGPTSPKVRRRPKVIGAASSSERASSARRRPTPPTG